MPTASGCQSGCAAARWRTSFIESLERTNGIARERAWRAEIRRQARADKIKTDFNEAIVWAVLVRDGCPDALVGSRRYPELLARTVPLAVDTAT